MGLDQAAPPVPFGHDVSASSANVVDHQHPAFQAFDIALLALRQTFGDTRIDTEQSDMGAHDDRDTVYVSAAFVQTAFDAVHRADAVNQTTGSAASVVTGRVAAGRA